MLQENLRFLTTSSPVHVGSEKGQGPSARAWVKNVDRTYGLNDTFLLTVNLPFRCLDV